MNMIDKDFTVNQPGGMAQSSEKILPAKIQTLGFLVTRATALCERIAAITSRCGAPMPDQEPNNPTYPESQDYITQLEINLSWMEGLIQSMDNYLTELERII